MDHQAHVAVLWSKRPVASRLARDGGSLARCTLASFRFASSSRASTPKNGGERGALPRIIVYQHAVCAADLIT
jgi:hypothetical protein